MQKPNLGLAHAVLNCQLISRFTLNLVHNLVQVAAILVPQRTTPCGFSHGEIHRFRSAHGHGPTLLWAIRRPSTTQRSHLSIPDDVMWHVPSEKRAACYSQSIRWYPTAKARQEEEEEGRK
jgi:hypothetical protein